MKIHQLKVIKPSHLLQIFSGNVQNFSIVLPFKTLNMVKSELPKTKPELARLTEVIQIVRTQTGWSMNEVSRRLGYRAEAYTRNIISGEKGLSKLFIEKLTSKFGVNEQYIYLGREPKFIAPSKLTTLIETRTSYEVSRETFPARSGEKENLRGIDYLERSLAMMQKAFDMQEKTFNLYTQTMNQQTEAKFTAERQSKKDSITFEMISAQLQHLLVRLGLQCKLWKTEDEAIAAVRNELFGFLMEGKSKGIFDNEHSFDKVRTQ